ncbi:hypothetical protein YA24_19750 [Klebsiella aerogenes]|nr:hypothetical protein YA24_19750 [Klebsiella aerogenes]
MNNNSDGFDSFLRSHWLTRLAGIVSVASIATGFTKWPDIMFVSACVMIVLWLHAEYQWTWPKVKDLLFRKK